jgi:hypothetical protein
MTRVKLTGISIVLAILAMLVLGAPVLAQTPTPPAPTMNITLSPTSGFSVVTIEINMVNSGSYYLNSPFTVYWDGQQIPTVPAEVFPSGEGSYYATAIISVPTQTTPGNHTVRVQAIALLYNESPVTISGSATFNVIDMKGPQGLPGVQGPQGDRGPAGAPGSIGPSGPTGPSGGQGGEGARGAAGATGPMGPMGPAGPAGPSGLAGAIGPAGAPGVVTGLSILAFIMALACIVLFVLAKLKKWIFG